MDTTTRGRRRCGGKTRYGGLAREASREPLVSADTGSLGKDAPESTFV